MSSDDVYLYLRISLNVHISEFKTQITVLVWEPLITDHLPL